MINEIRNELLEILSMMKKDTTTEEGRENQQVSLYQLLQRFEYDINDQLKELDYKKRQLEDNLKTLEYVRKELGIK